MQFGKRLLAAGATALALAAGAPAPAVLAAADQPKPGVDTVLATVDGVKITLGHVIALRERLPEQYKALPDDLLFKGIVDQLIQQTVMMNAMKDRLDTATRYGLDNETRAFLATALLDRLGAAEVPEADIKALYAERYDGKLPEQEWNASHILVKTKAEAEEIIRLLNEGADFAELARERSTGPSGKRGGELGWFGKGQMIKPFEDAVAKLAKGEIGGPVETRFGWHVIRLNDIRDVPVPGLEEVRKELVDELRQRAVDAEIERLTKAAKVERSDVQIDPALIRDTSLFEAADGKSQN